MTSKPLLNKPEWASSEPVGANVIEPTAHKTTGFIQTGGLPEKPSYQELNYLFKSTYDWFSYLETITDEIKEFTITAGEDLNAGDVVRISGGDAFKADNTTLAGITDVVGINVQTVTVGNVAEIAYGFYDDFSALTVGETYYVGVSGGITSTRPIEYQVELGVAVSTNRINLDIQNINNYVSAYDQLTFLFNSRVIDRKRFWATENGFNSNSVWVDVTPERIRSIYIGANPVDIWNAKPIEDGKHKVYLKIELNGGGGAGDFLDIRIINDNSDTTIFEHTNIDVGNPGTTTIYSFAYDLANANVTSLNLGTTPLVQLTTYLDRTPDNGWTIQAKRSAGSGTSGTFAIRSVEFLLVEV
jgi:hypothetical protein